MSGGGPATVIAHAASGFPTITQALGVCEHLELAAGEPTVELGVDEAAAGEQVMAVDGDG